MVSRDAEENQDEKEEEEETLIIIVHFLVFREHSGSS